jgi:hypothetical protein
MTSQEVRLTAGHGGAPTASRAGSVPAVRAIGERADGPPVTR